MHLDFLHSTPLRSFPRFLDPRIIGEERIRLPEGFKSPDGDFVQQSLLFVFLEIRLVDLATFLLDGTMFSGSDGVSTRLGLGADSESIDTGEVLEIVGLAMHIFSKGRLHGAMT